MSLVFFHGKEEASLPLNSLNDLQEIINNSESGEEDKDDDLFQLFSYQILSLYQNLSENFIIIDSYGRKISNLLEIYDLYSELIDSKENIIKLWIYDLTPPPTTNIPPTTQLLDSNPWKCCCTTIIFPNNKIIQPYYKIIDTNYEICYFCSSLFDKNLLTTTSTSTSSLTSLHQYQCQSQDAINFGLSLFTNDEILLMRNQNNILNNYEISWNNPLGKYFRRQLLYEALSLQPKYKNFLTSSPEENQFEARFQSYLQTIQAYENSHYQAIARERIDYDILFQNIQEYQAADPTLPADILFLKGLVKWFKKSFFKWCNRPPCTTPLCDMNNKPADSLGMGPPTEEERNVHWASRVELYKCTRCQATIRFPRINNPRSLLDTKKGRCGEWANCFALICRSLGLDVRWVIDYTDHVWVEVWCDSLERYIHIDPCEMAVNTPLLYEVGWKKKLSFLFSFSRFGVSDSTPRYSRLFNSDNMEFRQRRSEVTEKLISDLVQKYDHRLESDYVNQINSQRKRVRHGGPLPMKEFINVIGAGKEGIENLIYGTVPGGYISDLSLEAMKERKRKDIRDLMRLEMMLPGEDELREEEKKGRQSGDREWREQRGEIGGDEKDTPDQEVVVGTLKERYQWMDDDSEAHLCYFSPHSKSIEVFVSSITMSDPLDNRQNGYISNLNNLHTYESEGGASCGGGVYATHAIMVNGLPICRAGRGHNVAILSLETGELIGSRSFDTHGSDGFDMIQYLLPYTDGGTSPERFLILICVIDSGENLSPSCVQFLTQLSITVPNSMSNTSFTSTYSSRTIQDNHSVHQPEHRQSYIQAVITCPGGSQKILWSYFDHLPSMKGPVSCRMRITFDNEPLRGENDLILTKEFHYRKMKFTNEFSFDSVIPLQRIEISNENLFEVSHDMMCRLCDKIEKLHGDILLLVYRHEVDSSSSEKLYGYLHPISSLSSLKKIDHTASLDRQELYLKYVTANTLPVPPQPIPQAVVDVTILPSVDLFRYIPLGGQHHPDTVSFDTTFSLISLSKFLSCSLSQISLSEVIFYGGDIVRGVQCVYSHPYGIFHGPLLYGSYEKSLNQEKERSCRISLSQGTGVVKHIRSVSIRYGALVDSVTLTLSSGEVITAGGNGGGDSSILHIPEGCKVIGFYGGLSHPLPLMKPSLGLGGHVHNFGVVVAIPSILPPPSRPLDPILGNLFQFTSVQQLGSCGMLGGTLFGKTSHMTTLLQRSNSIYLLDIAHRFLLSSQSVGEKKQAISCILLYTKNILKNIHEPKFRKIKFSNNHFREKIISCSEALSLMACSPLCWSYTRHVNDGSCVEAVGYLWIQDCWKQNGEDGIDYRQFYERIWIEWIEKYILFLEEVGQVYFGGV